MIVFRPALGALLLCASAPLSAQAPIVPVPASAGHAVAVGDSARPPYTPRPLAVLPGSILPGNRIIAYYGTPLSKRMGILGEIPPAQMLARLDSTAREWEKADSTMPVKRALHMIVTVAQASAGRDGMYRGRTGDQSIATVAHWAEEHGYLLFVDIQVGRSTVEAELPRLLPWLRKPYVHLGIDPEFAMSATGIPGKRIGTLDARHVNHAIDVLAKLVEEHGLPPKVLVVHRFTDKMLTNHQNIRADPRVQVVIHADGFGSPALKKNIFDLVVTRRPVQYAGLKIFYKNDKPRMTMAQVLALRPIPLYIQYQ
ncbi:MAG: hypothetical protein H0W15_01075 [Gemmatimonadales bacterium]|nr:hypothetical protein [Gemmatimonadales bacterium]